jgi:hypothetical protein
MKEETNEALSRKVLAGANLTTATMLHKGTMWTLPGEVREVLLLEVLLLVGETSLQRSMEILQLRKESNLDGAMLHQRIKTKVAEPPAAGEKLTSLILELEDGETTTLMVDRLQLEVRCQMIVEAEAEVATEEVTMEAVAAEAALEHASSVTRKAIWRENALILTLEMEEIEEEVEALVEAKAVEVATPALNAIRKDTWHGSAPTLIRETEVAEDEEAQGHVLNAMKKDTWLESAPILTREVEIETETEAEADQEAEVTMIEIEIMAIQALTSVNEETMMIQGGDKALITSGAANQTMKLKIGGPQEASLRQVEEMMAVLGVATRIMVEEAGARTPSPSLKKEVKGGTPSQANQASRAAGERTKIVSLFILA